MREIKFRAWMNPDKVMLSHEELMSIPVTYHDVFEGNSKYPCMQYTGLKDKNGKEIYEGDILENKKYPTVGIHTVRWANNIEYCGFSLCKVGFDIGELFLNSNFDNLEVIGNIYENPELLEDK